MGEKEPLASQPSLTVWPDTETAAQAQFRVDAQMKAVGTTRTGLPSRAFAFHVSAQRRLGSPFRWSHVMEANVGSAQPRVRRPERRCCAP